MSDTIPPDAAPSFASDTGESPSTTGRLARTRAYRPWVPAPDARLPMLIDVVATALLAIGAVNAFDPAFGGGLWWSVGLIGCIAGLAVAYVTVQFKWSPITSVIATVVGFLVLGGRGVPDTAIAGVLPGPGTPGALFDGATHGWARLMTTVPPVGTVDHLTAVIYLGGFVGAGGALHLARRTRSTWLPLVPALVVMIAGILVGTHTPASTLTQGAGMALVAIVWTSLRGVRVRPRVHVVGTNRWSRRLTGVAFAVLIVAAGLAVGHVQQVAGPDHRSVLRDHTQPPFDPNDYPSPLAGYPEWRAQAQRESKTKKQTVLTVKGLPPKVPLRVAVMDIYDGTVWLVGGPSNAQDQSGSGRFVRVGSNLTAPGDREPGQSLRTRGPTTSVNLSVDLDHYREVWVPTLDGVHSLHFTSGDESALAKGLRYNKVTASAAVPQGVGQGVDIHERAQVPVVSYVGKGKTRDAIVGDAPADPAVSLPAVEDTGGQKGLVSLSQEAQKLTGRASSDYAKAKALEAALSKKGQGYFWDGFHMTSGNPLSLFRSGHNLYELSQFLGATNPGDKNKPMFIGNAERYSAAMAGMARTVGLPARVVVGFRADADDKDLVKPKGGEMAFTADQADAWVEIAFKGVGWVAFYPTPPRSHNHVPKTKPQQQSSKTADVQAQPPVSPPPNPATLQDQLDHAKHQSDASSAPFHIPAWVWLMLKIIFYPLIVVAAIVGAITGYKRWRRNRRRTRGTPVDRVTGAWAEMLDQLRDLGARVPRHGTRREIAAATSGDRWDQLSGFAAGIDAAMFGPDDPDDESVDSMWQWVETERGKLLGALERKRRWLARLNLASIWPWR